MNITLRQLQVFSTVARHGNVSNAAEELRITQSAASMALGELERQLKDKLFDRVGRRLSLNERGRMLLPRAVEILARVREVGELFSSEDDRMAGVLNVGTSSTIGNYLMPRLLGAFTTDYPLVRVQLEVGNTEQILQEVVDFRIDLGAIEGFCHLPGVEAIPWVRDRLAVVAPPEHPLARRGSISAKELAEARWILRERGSGTREIFQAAAAKGLVRLEVFLELGHTEAIKQAVEAGLGISCLSRMALARNLEEGTLVELPTPFLDLERNFFLVIHREKYRTGVLRAFFDYCRTRGPQTPLR